MSGFGGDSGLARMQPVGLTDSGRDFWVDIAAHERSVVTVELAEESGYAGWAIART